MKIAMGSVVLGVLIVAGDVRAQMLPAAPVKSTAPSAGHGAYDWFGSVGLVCGAGASHDLNATTPTVQCGGVAVMPIFEFEAGVMGPQSSHSAVSGYLTTNVWLPLTSLKDAGKARGVPLVFGGYKRMFETGSGVDYGLAYAHPIDSAHSIQFEVRDDWVFSNPHQHNVVFRVVWLVGLPD